LGEPSYKCHGSGPRLDGNSLGVRRSLTAIQAGLIGRRPPPQSLGETRAAAAGVRPPDRGLQRRMLAQECEHHRRILGALGLVHRKRIGEGELVQLIGTVEDLGGIGLVPLEEGVGGLREILATPGGAPS